MTYTYFRDESFLFRMPDGPRSGATLAKMEKWTNHGWEPVGALPDVITNAVLFGVEITEAEALDEINEDVS
jgi:hypothetical protein